MPRKIIPTLIILILFMNWAGRSIAASRESESVPWENKVNSQVMDGIQRGETEFLVIMKDQADLSHAADLKSKEEKGKFVYLTLTKYAENNQKLVRTTLDELGVKYRPFWIANMLWVHGDLGAVQQIAQLGSVSRIESNPLIPIKDPEVSLSVERPLTISGIEWNIGIINAPEVWALGHTGEGIVIGGQDTGYDWDHPALKSKYRGWDGSTADHNYNWHDAITSGGGRCGANSNEPCDDHDHGTHTMGTMVGDDGGSNQIGVAPGATWIGCRNMNEGWGTPATYTECYEWFIAPYDLTGDSSDADPTKAPHVINNSWSCPSVEGCTYPDILLTVVQNVRAAGIVTVHSAGNEGAACETRAEPAAIYQESFTIGATNNGNSIASFSSRGPVTVDGSDRLKPNVVAPGVNIRSSVPGTGYESEWNGTSMAAPHVTGLIALLLSANPSLIGQVDRIENIIEASSVQLTSTENCSGVLGSSIPNNTYGWGRVDAYAAVLESLKLYFPLIVR